MAPKSIHSVSARFPAIIPLGTLVGQPIKRLIVDVMICNVRDEKDTHKYKYAVEMGDYVMHVDDELHINGKISPLHYICTTTTVEN